VTERTHGTLVRLRMAPLTRTRILGGKALACLLSILVVELMLLGVAFGFGVRRGLGHPDAALHDRRRHGAAVRHAGVDAGGRCDQLTMHSEGVAS